MKSILLATKFHPPTLPHRWVSRPFLNKRLDESLHSHQQITLISAPAGFGKTTCIADWINTPGRWPVAWLSLDPADDDPQRFFSYFIAALQTIVPALGAEIEAVLRAGQLPPGEIITATLVNDLLAAKKRFLIILDDFHVIQDMDILKILENFIQNLPRPVHMILVTREDPPWPLAQWRARNRLTEIRARDLRFDTHDTRRFLNEVMDLSLAAEDLALLEEKTEGWIVGLQLLGLSARDHSNPSAFIAALSGSHRHILAYLTEQVLNLQPEEIRRFLLQTSILDRLNGSLCAAVTGRADSQVILERLLTGNMLLVSLDDDRRWYRYHHLFADLLRDHHTRHQESMSGLHQRASRWYAQAGMVREAIHHALCAADYAFVVNLLESHAMEMIMRGEVKTVNSWVQVIPPEWVSHSPKIHLAFTWMHLLRGAYAQASPHLEALRKFFDSVSPGSQDSQAVASLKAEWLVLQSLLRYMQGNYDACMALANQAFALASELDTHLHSLVRYVQASVHWVWGDHTQAVEGFQKSIHLSQAGDHLTAEMMSTVGMAGMALEQGRLHLTFEIASQAVERIERTGVLPPVSAVVFAALGDAHYQWCQVEAAQRCFQRAHRLSILGGSNTVTILSHGLLSRLALLTKDLDLAARQIQAARDLLPLDVPPYVLQEVTAQQVRVFLAQNRLASAQLLLQGQGFAFQDAFTFPPIPAGHSLTSAAGLLYNSCLHTLICLPGGENRNSALAAGLDLASQLISRATQNHQFLVALEAQLLRAQIHHLLENHAASRSDYLQVLDLAEPEGFIGIFVEQNPAVIEALSKLSQEKHLRPAQAAHITRILKAFSRLQPRSTSSNAVQAAHAALIEPLTDRELDVLRLMASGLKYQEIAEKLFISLNTVRHHVKAIYAKFNVHKRIRAIDKARQFNLI